MNLRFTKSLWSWMTSSSWKRFTISLTSINVWIHFSRKKYWLLQQMKLKNNDIHIVNVVKVKDWDVLVDSKLTFQYHIERNLGFLFRSTKPSLIFVQFSVQEKLSMFSQTLETVRIKTDMVFVLKMFHKLFLLWILLSLIQFHSYSISFDQD